MRAHHNSTHRQCRTGEYASHVFRPACVAVDAEVVRAAAAWVMALDMTSESASLPRDLPDALQFAFDDSGCEAVHIVRARHH